MKTEFFLQFFLLLILLLANSSDGFFLEYPKKAFMEFLQSLKEKKEAKKKPQGNNIHHYHIHYYPAQIHVVSGISAKAPEKHELDKIHNDHLSSLGWSDHEYKYTPESKITIHSSGSHDLWDYEPSPYSWDQGIVETDHFETIDHSENQGILLQVPLSQHITIQHPRSAKKSKTSLLAAFFHKFAGSHNSVHK